MYQKNTKIHYLKTDWILKCIKIIKLINTFFIGFQNNLINYVRCGNPKQLEERERDGFYVQSKIILIYALSVPLLSVSPPLCGNPLQSSLCTTIVYTRPNQKVPLLDLTQNIKHWIQDTCVLDPEPRQVPAHRDPYQLKNFYCTFSTEKFLLHFFN